MRTHDTRKGGLTSGRQNRHRDSCYVLTPTWTDRKQPNSSQMIFTTPEKPPPEGPAAKKIKPMTITDKVTTESIAAATDALTGATGEAGGNDMAVIGARIKVTDTGGCSGGKNSTVAAVVETTDKNKVDALEPHGAGVNALTNATGGDGAATTVVVARTKPASETEVSLADKTVYVGVRSAGDDGAEAYMQFTFNNPQDASKAAAFLTTALPAELAYGRVGAEKKDMLVKQIEVRKVGNEVSVVANCTEIPGKLYHDLLYYAKQLKCNVIEDNAKAKQVIELAGAVRRHPPPPLRVRGGVGRGRADPRLPPRRHLRHRVRRREEGGRGRARACLRRARRAAGRLLLRDGRARRRDPRRKVVSPESDLANPPEDDIWRGRRLALSVRRARCAARARRAFG